VKLGLNKLCPIHRSRTCCGRQQLRRAPVSRGKWEQVRPGVRRIRDRYADHPDGYRYKLSPGELRKVVDQKIRDQQAKCAHCGELFLDYSDIEADHLKPKGLGGARADDRPENIRAVHRWCNSEKGSRRI